MFVDITGKTRIKLAIHTKSLTSTGRDSLESIAREYINRGYDAIALTENWIFSEDREVEGIKVISGCEYSIGTLDEGGQAYHIVGIGMTSDPEVPIAWKNMIKTARAKSAETVKMIQKHNGFAFVALPDNNSNAVEDILELGDFDGIEIYNSECEYGKCEGGYAGEAVDRLALFGMGPIILASDGVACYDDEAYKCSVMVEAAGMDTMSIIRALRQGKSYATEGPEIHLERIGADKVRVSCTPAVKIEFFTNETHCEEKIHRGEDLIRADYCIKDGERYVRAEITDAEGRMAWSNIIRFDELYRN